MATTATLASMMAERSAPACARRSAGGVASAKKRSIRALRPSNMLAPRAPGAQDAEHYAAGLRRVKRRGAAAACGHRILQAMRIPRPLPCVLVALLVLLSTAPSRAVAQRDRTVVGGQVGYARSWISTSADSLGVSSEDRQGAYVGLFVRTRVFKWVSCSPRST
jgi:hypothetical protein